MDLFDYVRAVSYTHLDVYKRQVQYYADTAEDEELKTVLYDVLDTPVSPELLPPKDGEIAQKTEDLVGPYELHDFYLYYMPVSYTHLDVYKRQP